jgi:catechol 2,3-dioxygenase-like lactoylglutathione lyase family enzyme
MTAFELDHINIRTARLAASIEFYGSVIGMTLVPPGKSGDMSRGAYALDGEGNAVVHLVGTEAYSDGPPAVRGEARLGMIDHFALRCTDPDGLVSRLIERGIKFEDDEVPAVNARLIFVRDPNGILLEMNSPLK